MEEKKVNVNSLTLENGKMYVQAREIAKKLAELEGIIEKKDGILIENTPFKKNINHIINGDYIDTPGNEIDEDYEENIRGILQKISICIPDGTKIVERRSKRGINRWITKLMK